jgi:DNA-binding NtrC family response regulator
MLDDFSTSICLVDDNEICLKVYKQMLTQLGYSQVHVFTQVDSFLQALESKLKIIFLDYDMDNLNGIEVLKKIKRFDPNMLVVFISGQQDIEIAVNALKYGAMDYLIKKEVSLTKLGAIMTKAIYLIDQTKKKRSFFNF